MNELVNCPACRETMLAQDFGGVVVNVCSQGCQGIWFDAGELERLDSARKGMGPALDAYLRALPGEAPASLELEASATCPLCRVALTKTTHDLMPTVEFAVCNACRGAFLPAQSFARLRDRPPSHKEFLALERRLRSVARTKNLRERAIRNATIGFGSLFWT